jgi:hypothetical protein
VTEFNRTARCKCGYLVLDHCDLIHYEREDKIEECVRDTGRRHHVFVWNGDPCQPMTPREEKQASILGQIEQLAREAQRA